MKENIMEKVRLIVPNEIEIGKEFPAKLERVEEFPLPVDGSLLRAKNGYKVYWMQDGKRRWVETGDVFDIMAAALGFSRNDIQPIELWKLKTIEEGKTISRWPEVGAGLDPETRIDKIIHAYVPEQTYNMRLPQAKELGFNMFFSHKIELDFWETHLEIARKLGMKAIVHVIESPDRARMKACIDNVKDHPACYAYGTMDDIHWREFPKDKQRAIYDLIKELDPSKPVVVAGADWKWEEFFEPRAWDILLYEIYAYKKTVVDPDEYLRWMCDRLGDYDLTGKRVIPLLQTFGPRGAEDFWLKPEIERSYGIVSEKLGVKSSGCWDWKDIAKKPEFQKEVKIINADR